MLIYIISYSNVFLALPDLCLENTYKGPGHSRAFPSSSFDFIKLQKGENNCYGILQLTPEAEKQGLLFLSSARLLYSRRKPEFANYRCVYNGLLIIQGQKRVNVLNTLYRQFNIFAPGDFHGHILSVRDIILLKLNREITCWYVDPHGYALLTDFLPAIF